jgi:oligo-1,6-glucosidase
MLNRLLALALLATSLTATAQSPTQLPAQTPATINGYQPKWWKQAVIYQVYPRSFSDSNGDGIGDLNGITARLDYLQRLGVDVIWLSPHYDSPNADNGYDIRDYRKVMAEFGTMDDFDRMLAAIKSRHMRLIIDLVVNHTSDEHHWFVESRSSRTNPYRDYYIWRDGRPNPADPAHPLPPNNYPSYFSGSAWQYDPPTQQFYLHYFAVKQPDLNWDNPKVRDDVFSLMRFWLDKGVDGFRMDVIPLISKPTGMPDLTAAQLDAPPNAYANGPHLTEYLQQMDREVLSKYDDMSVGEATGTTLAQTSNLVDDRRHELNMIFNFDAIKLGRSDFGASHFYTWTVPQLKAIYDAHAAVLTKHDWDTVFLSNHDNPRIVSTFGDTSTPELRDRSAKLYDTLILTLRGTPFLYQGDELGMTNYPFKTLADFDDISVKNAYQALVVTGKVPEADFLAESAKYGRDNARTPMQWSSAPNAGFTTPTAKPWLAINPNYKTLNAAAELRNPNSVYHYTQRAIELHHAHPAFIYGDYKDLDPDHPQVYAYTRSLGAERFLVILNISKTATDYTIPYLIEPSSLVLSNTSTTEALNGRLHLQPWEARVYRY